MVPRNGEIQGIPQAGLQLQNVSPEILGMPTSLDVNNKHVHS